MNKKQTHLDWRFGLLWLVTCALGTTILGMAAFISMWGASDAVGKASNELLGGLVAGALFGGFLALGGTLGPGLLMRNKSISVGRWIGFSVAAGAIVMGTAFALAFSQFDTLDSFAGIVFIGLALGLPIGLVQWHLLKQQGISAAVWPLISVIGYTLAAVVSISWSGEGREWIALSGMGLLLGAVTGLGMMWLLRRETAVAI